MIWMRTVYAALADDDELVWYFLLVAICKGLAVQTFDY